MLHSGLHASPCYMSCPSGLAPHTRRWRVDLPRPLVFIHTLKFSTVRTRAPSRRPLAIPMQHVRRSYLGPTQRLSWPCGLFNIQRGTRSSPSSRSRLQATTATCVRGIRRCRLFLELLSHWGPALHPVSSKGAGVCIGAQGAGRLCVCSPGRLTLWHKTKPDHWCRLAKNHRFLDVGLYHHPGRHGQGASQD